MDTRVQGGEGATSFDGPVDAAAPRGAAAPRARTREGESVCNPGRFVTASRPFMRQKARRTPPISPTLPFRTLTHSPSRANTPLSDFRGFHILIHTQVPRHRRPMSNRQAKHAAGAILTTALRTPHTPALRAALSLHSRRPVVSRKRFTASLRRIDRPHRACKVQRAAAYPQPLTPTHSRHQPHPVNDSPRRYGPVAVCMCASARPTLAFLTP